MMIYAPGVHAAQNLLALLDGYLWPLQVLLDFRYQRL